MAHSEERTNVLRNVKPSLKNGAQGFFTGFIDI